MNTEAMIQKLVEQTRQILNQGERLKNLDLYRLTWRKDKQSWNILECLEHLNLYGAFYLPAIECGIRNSKTKSDKTFKSGRLGAYFAKSMLPKEKLNKMKTFRDKNPIHRRLDRDVVDRFINQQKELLDLLNQSRQVSLSRVKIPTSISRMLRLKLGDTFQFYINHILRHLKQIERIETEGSA